MITKIDYKNKFELLHPFMEEICRSVKKEIKQEFVQKGVLRKSEKGFNFKDVSRFFYEKIMGEEDGKVGEWLASSWIYRNAEIFHFFHEELLKVNPNYDALENFSLEQETRLVEMSLERFGGLRTYIFSVLNSVVFSEKTFEELRKKAFVEFENLNRMEEVSVKELSLEDLKKDFEQEKLKIEEKFEKRLQGIIKKYQVEVAGYRKQIAQLQKKLETFHVK